MIGIGDAIAIAAVCATIIAAILRYEKKNGNGMCKEHSGHAARIAAVERCMEALDKKLELIIEEVNNIKIMLVERRKNERTTVDADY